MERSSRDRIAVLEIDWLEDWKLRFRALGGGSRGSQHELQEYTKVFKMRLVRDTSLFHENVVFEGSNGRQIAFDPKHAYSGILEGK
ncbi:hypothetical protein WN48_07879 [Eufriesea mexicana]|uniref:Uncharacterized protein n=1 Tax=Eufriesea mexicana TaxID=516756 RepID=A0A310SER9_9HYME|nr:hypothetical protein WN48_07879 [Eufriesea mexicana]